MPARGQSSGGLCLCLEPSALTERSRPCVIRSSCQTQRKCRRRTTGLLTRSARGGGQTAPAVRELEVVRSNPDVVYVVTTGVRVAFQAADGQDPDRCPDRRSRRGRPRSEFGSSRRQHYRRQRRHRPVPLWKAHRAATRNASRHVETRLSHLARCVGGHPRSADARGCRCGGHCSRCFAARASY